jgi:acyl-CoA thioesterase I
MALIGLAACGSGQGSDKSRDSSAVVANQPQSKRTTSSVPVAASGSRRTMLFVGTSLTAGLGLEPDSAFPMVIQRKLDSAGFAFDVVNAGVSGETSSGLLDRLDWLLRGQFQIMVLETGANDGLRGIPATTLRSNLERALARIKEKRPDARVVLVQMEALPNLGPTYAREFHEVYPAVAKSAGVTLLPFLLTDVAGHRELNQSDGVHPNYVGERIVANNVWRWLKPVLDSTSAR